MEIFVSSLFETEQTFRYDCLVMIISSFVVSIRCRLRCLAVQLINIRTDVYGGEEEDGKGHVRSSSMLITFIKRIDCISSKKRRTTRTSAELTERSLSMG